LITLYNARNVLWCTVIYGITVLLLRTFILHEIRTWETADELRQAVRSDDSHYSTLLQRNGGNFVRERNICKIYKNDPKPTETANPDDLLRKFVDFDKLLYKAQGT
jgi:hypothetical protein